MKIAVLICFLMLLGVPLLFRPTVRERASEKDALELIVITPHNEQIRYEFARAFDAWHRKRFGRAVNVIYNVPGGTAEIRKMLEAQYTAALENNQSPGGNADLVFGGGSYEHDQLKRPIALERGGEKRQTTISVPVDFDQKWLDETYGANTIAGGRLYDKDRYWFGQALSGFGIVFNMDLLADAGATEPTEWDDLCDPRLQGTVALVNPNQSSSIKTAFESILQRRGWVEGWRILRRAGANARYFSGSSLKPPIDVTQGQAAMAICIDFYGRFEMQSIKDAGDADRVGYIDPAGGSTIDSDPVSMLRGAPHPELAKQFIEFSLSEEGQALWQFHRRSGASGSSLGPEKFELRRLPIVRSMYTKHMGEFIDPVDPFAMATPIEKPDPYYRDLIGPVFAGLVMDTHDDLKKAWKAIISHPAYPHAMKGMARAGDVSDPTLQAMLELFDSMPRIDGAGGVSYSLGDPAALGRIRDGWLKKEWKDQGLWSPEDSSADALRRRVAEQARRACQEIVRMARRSTNDSSTAASGARGGS